MPADYRSQVLAATDLVELISQSVALKRRGRTYVGLCPFHQEKTPSFHVDPAKQVFRCFGCKASGTAFDWIMKREHVEFKDALHTLADMAGIVLPSHGGSDQGPSQKQALLEANSAACQFFQNLLLHPQQGEAARAYLKKRGFTDESARHFQIGLAADAWDALLKGPVGRKFTPQILLAAGLVKARQQGEGFYDTFRNRLMFPIRNERGQIIAFGGRVMPGSEDPAKYLNSPETPLFTKSKCLFGIDFARQKIVESRTAAVVEGYTDVVMAHQYGATNVVSALGTALTGEHVKVLRRFADRIVLLFDADAAGDSAADRVVQLFLSEEVDIAVASLPDGLDPDEYLLKSGTAEFEKLLAGAPDALNYAWKQTHRRFVSSDGLTGQQKTIEQYMELLARARGSGPVDPIRWGMALVQVHKLTGIPADDLNRRFQGRHRTGPAKAFDGDRPTNAGQNANSAHTVSSARPIPEAPEKAGRQVLGILLVEPHRWTDVQFALQVEDFGSAELRRLAELYWDHQRHEGETALAEFLAVLPDPALSPLAIELVNEVEDLPDREAMLKANIAFLGEVRQKREAQKILPSGPDAATQELTDQQLRMLQDNARRNDLRRIGH